MESLNSHFFKKPIFLVVIFIFLFFGFNTFANPGDCIEPPDPGCNSGDCEIFVPDSDLPGTVPGFDNSDLYYCEYRVESNEDETLDWTMRTCNSHTPTITIGSGGNCRDSGEGACVIWLRATDNAGNTSMPTSRTLNICIGNCYIDGQYYDDGECDPTNKCQYCNVSEDPEHWTPVPSGKICISSNLVPVSSSNYCYYDENCDTGDCSATEWWTSCNGAGSCRAASNHTDSYSETVYASPGYSLTSNCGTTGTTLCGPTYLPSSGPGDNNYGDGGSDECQGMCDGDPSDSTPCDYAVYCKGIPFDFSIDIDPTSGSIMQGDSVSATVILTLAPGASAQDVSFYILSGLPEGALASFIPPSCNPSCSSIMTINTSATTPTGNYSINVCGTSGDKTHCVVYGLTVTETGVEIVPPEVTTAPATNVAQTSATLNGILNSMGNADSCLVWFEWGTTPSYGNNTTLVSMTATGPFTTIISGLDSNTTYYFEAFAKNGGSW